jgi:ABC-type Fe3+ transport system permease subunit
MIVGRLIGWVLFLAGLVVLARDVIGWVDTHVFAPIVLGQLWFDLAAGSLNLVQAIVQRYIHPALWDPVITSVLFLWASPVLIVLGVVLIALFRRRGNGRWRRRH